MGGQNRVNTFGAKANFYSPHWRPESGTSTVLECFLDAQSCSKAGVLKSSENDLCHHNKAPSPKSDWKGGGGDVATSLRAIHSLCPVSGVFLDNIFLEPELHSSLRCFETLGSEMTAITILRS